MHIFFVPPSQIKNQNITIWGQDAHHIQNVLKMSKGEKIIIQDGENHKYLCEIEEITAEKIIAKIIKQENSLSENKIKIALAQSLPKASKLDFIIQKTTELGIDKIIPFTSERSIPRIEEKISAKLTRWQKIAQSAASQSGRSHIPQVESLKTWEEILSGIKNYGLSLIPWENEKENSLKSILLQNKIPQNILVIIGPEGGFSHAEVNSAKKMGAIPISLGPRILRCETAPLNIISILNYVFES